MIVFHQIMICRFHRSRIQCASFLLSVGSQYAWPWTLSVSFIDCLGNTCLLYCCILYYILTLPLGTPLDPDNCRQIRMWLSPGKPTRWAVTTMGSNDLVVGEDHMLGPSCQRYNLQAGRCGSMNFGSSPMRGKTLISNPRCLAEVSTCGKDFRR